MSSKPSLRIVVGADPFAVDLKNELIAHLRARDCHVVDVGMKGGEALPYYRVAVECARAIQDGDADRGVLMCGTGQGMAIVANKHRGIVASVVESSFAARMAKAINNANVLALGAMLTAPFLAKEIVDTWLATEHTQGLAEHESFLRAAIVEVDAICKSQHGLAESKESEASV